MCTVARPHMCESVESEACELLHCPPVDGNNLPLNYVHRKDHGLTASIHMIKDMTGGGRGGGWGSMAVWGGQGA